MRSDNQPPARAAGGASSSALGDAAVEVIKVLEERLTIVKQTVDSGGAVRLRKVVHADVVDVAEPLALETLDVKRVSINREVEGPVGIRYEGDVTVFPILEERLVTRKQLILVEEVHVTKISRVDRASQQVTLRREEIIIERQDPASGEWSIVGSDEC
jgi:uncharacterized protein (TIGR02271 family)